MPSIRRQRSRDGRRKHVYRNPWNGKHSRTLNLLRFWAPNWADPNHLFLDPFGSCFDARTLPKSADFDLA